MGTDLWHDVARLARAFTVLVVMCFLQGLPGSAEATEGTQTPPSPSATGPYLGVVLPDWSQDAPEDYRGRLGAAPAVYGYDVPAPMTANDVTNLRAALVDADRAQECSKGQLAPATESQP